MKKILIVLTIALLFVGCTSDYYYAATFLRKFEVGKESATEKIYVSLPHMLLRTNSSLEAAAMADTASILDQINDSIFLEQFLSSFLYTLSRTAIPIVMVPDETSLPAADDQHFTVSFPQIEAEEYLQRTRSDFYTKAGTYYAYDYDMRHFSANVWLRLDAADSNGAVVFYNCETEEHFQGIVTSLSNGSATLKAEFERINVNDAYSMARKLGSECAILYVEKILAEYVCRTKGTNGSYFYYNPVYNSIDDVVPYDEGQKTSFQPLQ